MQFLDFLEENGNALATADAGRADAVLLVLLAQLVDNVSRNSENKTNHVSNMVLN